MENKPVESTKKKGVLREYGEALLTALLVAFLIRSFGIEAFKIPSGSMIPTLMVGDHIFVNKFIYGLRIPFTKTRLVHFRNPKRGEAIVFIYPVDESKDFIKRVIGLPGDTINLRGDDLYLNGARISRQSIEVAPDRQGGPRRLRVIPEAVAAQVGVQSVSAFNNWEEYDYFVEQEDGIRHLVQFDRRPSYDQEEIVVPPGHLFVMGDNRDNSSDSRDWGFVPLENVKGKAMFVWLSIDFDRRSIRWDRFGKWIE